MEAPVKVRLKKVPLRTVLRDVLRQHRLAYVVRDGLLTIDSQQNFMEERMERIEQRLDEIEGLLKQEKGK